MPLTLTYVHDHECSYKDEELRDFPTSHAGSSWIVVPVCEETMVELKLVRTEKY